MPLAAIGISHSSKRCEEQLANESNTWAEDGQSKELASTERYLDAISQDIVIDSFRPLNPLESSILQKRKLQPREFQ